MPKIPDEVKAQDSSDCLSVYIGIDPGVGGGITVLRDGVIAPELHPMPDTETDLAILFDSVIASVGNSIAQIHTLIEEQTPRPTVFFQKGAKKPTSTILKSTCILYGNYMLIRGMLHAYSLSFDEIRPQEWLKAMSIPSRPKGLADRKWKQELRGKAQQLHPTLPIWTQAKSVGKQLAISDSLLIATLCKQRYS